MISDSFKSKRKASSRPTIDFDRLYTEVDIVNLAKQLGMTVRGTQARCYNSGFHKHGDRTYSLTFGSKDRKNLFHCFTCGESGNTISLYQNVKKIPSFIDAAREMWSEFFGGRITSGLNTKFSLVYRNPSTPPPEPPEPGEYANIYTDLIRFCGPPTGNILSYLTGGKRGLTARTIGQCKFTGFEDGWRVEQYLRSKYPLEDLKSSGLFWPKFGDSSFIYRGAWVLIPFLKNDRVVFLQGRNLGGDKPKYLHLPGYRVPLYNQDVVMSADGSEAIYLCEGAFDAAMLQQQGRLAVAILGVNNFKLAHAKSLAPFRVIVALDNDDAGSKGANEVIALIRSVRNDADVEKFKLPDGIKDVTDYYLQLDKCGVGVKL